MAGFDTTQPLPCRAAREQSLEEGLQALLPVFPRACSSLGLSGAVGVGLHLPPNTKGTTGISKIEKYENEIRAFNEDPGGHDQD